MLVIVELKTQPEVLVRTANTIDDLYRIIETFQVLDLSKITLTDFGGYLQTKVNS